jgi:hypothetical protein
MRRMWEKAGPFCSLLFFSFCSIKRSPLLGRGFDPTHT